MNCQTWYLKILNTCLDKLAETNELQQLFHKLVLKAKDLNIIDGSSVAIDSTKLNSYEAAKPKKSIVGDG